mmetsp:Transcript_87677/g.251239  ORF Transcript_87677/g.251239 Transcript_87677/m.251239 type:complete len:208 (-) Transcript_87677:69-692(-)
MECGVLAKVNLPIGIFSHLAFSSTVHQVEGTATMQLCEADTQLQPSQGLLLDGSKGLENPRTPKSIQAEVCSVTEDCVRFAASSMPVAEATSGFAFQCHAQHGCHNTLKHLDIALAVLEHPRKTIACPSFHPGAIARDRNRFRAPLLCARVAHSSISTLELISYQRTPPYEHLHLCHLGFAFAWPLAHQWSMRRAARGLALQLVACR